MDLLQDSVDSLDALFEAFLHRRPVGRLESCLQVHFRQGELAKLVTSVRHSRTDRKIAPSQASTEAGESFHGPQDEELAGGPAKQAGGACSYRQPEEMPLQAAIGLREENLPRNTQY